MYEKGNASELVNPLLNVFSTIINQFMHSSDKKVAPGYHYILYLMYLYIVLLYHITVISENIYKIAQSISIMLIKMIIYFMWEDLEFDLNSLILGDRIMHTNIFVVMDLRNEL